MGATGNPQLSDFVLDRAYFAEMAETARAVGSPFLEGYVRLLIDAANLRSAVRCARMGKGSDFLSQVLLPGGNVEVHVLTSGKGNDLAAVFRAGPLSDAAAAGAVFPAVDHQIRIGAAFALRVQTPEFIVLFDRAGKFQRSPPILSAVQTLRKCL